ncbi:hypothetical protein BCR34DRAFT_674384 [Clohesyomyces aquaticus]|uniref:Amino acid permease/ SLC12A domain-containing protein n=1 Tax=Clohesyomyces aquaticus TaxID=1231657 RepID=A0A1Y1ZIM6_9PLEO|nr:hypothetical protein BCR34DRAFT_674384 [Clohesyomyces aquaticus]
MADSKGITDGGAYTLKSRHLQMIAIGGIIGPGLLVGSGNALRLAGPVGILISFSLVGIFVMQSLGELATIIPVTRSFIDYATRFLSMLGRSLIKAISISNFFILAIFISSGGTGPQKIGYKYCDDTGAFADSINGVARMFVIAETLYAGTEMVIIQVFWRILIFYVASRTITHMARNGMVPNLLGKTDKRGVPWAALIFTNSSAGTLYEALITLSGVATLIVWAVIELGQSVDDLPFKSLWYPWGTYACLAANLFLILFQGYTGFLNPFSAQDFVINYILLPFWHKTKIVRVEDMNIWTGRREDQDKRHVEVGRKSV